MPIKLNLYEDYQSDEVASPIPEEVISYETEIKNGTRQPLEQDPARKRRYLNALSRESSGNGVNLGGIFGGILKAVDVFAKKPEQPQQEEKPNYTPYLIGAAALLLVVVLIKKR